MVVPMFVTPPKVYSSDEDIARFVKSMRGKRLDPRHAEDQEALAFFDDLIADALAIPQKRADLERRVRDEIATHGSWFTSKPEESGQCS